jgi:hypothetical protein
MPAQALLSWHTVCSCLCRTLQATMQNLRAKGHWRYNKHPKEDHGGRYPQYPEPEGSYNPKPHAPYHPKPWTEYNEGPSEGPYGSYGGGEFFVQYVVQCCCCMHICAPGSAAACHMLVSCMPWLMADGVSA